MKKAFFFGDSNTFGYDPSGFMGGRYPRAARWTTILGENLAGRWEIASDGFPGRAIPSAAFEWNFLRSLLLEEMPLDLFAVMLGTNDLLGTMRPSAAMTAGRMDSLISFVQGIGETRQGGLDILLIAPPSFLLTDMSFEATYVSGDGTCADLFADEGKKLSLYYRQIAARRKIHFADAAEWDLPLAFDGVHLSEAGHAAFAEKMTEVFRNLDREENSGQDSLPAAP